MKPVAIVALGNPGSAYAATRHNIAWQLVDALARQHGLSWSLDKRCKADLAKWTFAGQTVTLLKPQTFMNLSGFTVGEFARFHKLKPHDFLVVCDEVQLPLAATKLTLGGSDGGHNGLADIIQRVGGNFHRLRLGVAPGEPTMLSLKDFVLQAFTAAEQKTITERLPSLVEALELILRVGPDRAMTTLNQRKSRARPSHERQPEA